MTVVSTRKSRLLRRTIRSVTRRGFQFVRRASLSGVLAASTFAATEVSAQLNIPPNQTGTATDTAGSSSFGNQAINFTAPGGTLTLNGQGVLVNNRLEARWYDNEFGTGFLNPISNLINATAEGVNELSGPLNLVDDAAFTAASVGLSDLETFSGLWRGFMNITAAGTHQFRTGSDDGSVFWIDLNRDGTFGAGELVVNHNRDQGYVLSPVTSIDLAPGNYPVAIGFYENGGGNRMDARFKRPADADLQFVDPSSQPGVWSYVQNQTQSADFSTNAINFNASGTVVVDPIRSAQARVGAVTIARGTTVTVNGSRLAAPSTTITTSGTGDVTFAGTGQFVAGTMNTSGNVINFISAGTGDGGLSLNRVNSNIAAGSTLTVQGGKAALAIGGGNTPIGNSAITLSGGTLSVIEDLTAPNGPGLFDTQGQFYEEDLFNPLLPFSPDSTNLVGWAGLDSKTNLDARLAARTPRATVPINTEINFPRGNGNLVNGDTNDEGGNIFSNVGVAAPFTGNDDFVTRFTGKLNVTNPGATEFLLMSNDGATMFLDLDQGPGTNWQKVVDNNRFSDTGGPAFQGHFSGSAAGVSNEARTVDPAAPTIPNLAAPNLSAGSYDFIVGSFNSRQNEYGIELYWTPAGGTQSIIPFAAGGPVTINNAINVSGNSGLDIQTPSATANAITIAPGGTLRKTGNDLTANITVGGAGTATLDVSGRMTTATINMPANAALRKIGSGDLVIGQLAPTTLGASTSLDVGAGRLVAIDGATGDSLGDAVVTLSGGTLAVQGDGTLPPLPTGPGLHAVTGDFFNSGLVFNQTHSAGRTDPASNGWSAFASVAAMDATLNPLTPAFNDVPINVPLNFPGNPADLAGGGNDDEGGNIFGASGIGVNLGNIPDINFAARFAGKLNVTQSGPTRFNVGSNSGGVMFIDLDTGPGTNWLLVADNNRFSSDGDNYVTRGTGDPDDPPIAQVPAPNLNAGAYDFRVGFFGHNDEADGLPTPTNNEAGIEVRWTPTGGAESIIPVAASGSALSFGNNIRVTENSTIDLGTTAFSASFGNINIDAGRTVTSTGGGFGGGLQVAGSIEGTGTLRAGTNHLVEFTKSGAASSGAPNLAIGAAGTMRFNPGSGSTFGGSAVATVTNDGLLHAASGITDLSGAVVTSLNPGGAILGGGIAGVTGRFYNTGLTFDQRFTAGRPDPAVNGWSAFGSVPAMDAALNPLTPAFNVPISTPLNFPGDITNLADGGTDDDPGNIFAPSGIGVDVGPAETTNFAVRFAGKLNVTQSGPTSFELLANDGAVMFLDLDTGPGTNWATVVDNNRFAGADGDADVVLRGSGNPANPPIAQIPAPNLTASQYDFIVGFFNHNDNSVDGIPLGNNQAGLEVYWTPAGGSRSIIPPANIAPPSAVQVDAGATLRLGAFVNPGTVNLAPTSRLELHGPTSKINVSALTIPGTPTAPTATLDVTDSALILDFPVGGPNPGADTRARIIAGRGGTDLLGTWNGPGITSSAAQADNSTLAVGYAVNADLPLGPYTTFRGQPVDDTSVIIRGTRIGDANLDGVVNDDDVTIVGATFGMTSGAVWGLGDFTYDGAVNDDDVTLLGALYDPTATPIGGAPVAVEGAVAAVPEPATWLMLSLGGLSAGLFGWRRRKSQQA
ncbi:MAG: PEP-CTERM sorting domain-containing protein [Pirellulales bacterium]